MGATAPPQYCIGSEKKSKIQHFCASKLLKTLGRIFAKSIFSQNHSFCNLELANDLYSLKASFPAYSAS
jgi:hypothetical protein